MRLFTWALLIAVAAALPVSADTVSSLVGDKDGFGIDGLPPVPVDGTEIYSAGATQGIDDPAFMDHWGFWQYGGAFSSPITYEHNFDVVPTPLLSAVLVIQHAGMGDERGPWDVAVNGTVVGQIGPDCDETESKIETFMVPVGLIGNNNVITLTYLDTENEGFAINFSELTLSDVPEPSTMALLGLGGLALLRRKRNRK